ncbi:MAG: hypothetical protein Hens3KO_25400 [Henriciella sp.]
MKQLVWMTAGFAALGLGACSPAADTTDPSAKLDAGSVAEAPKPDDSVAEFVALRSEAYTEANASEADLTELISVLPEAVSLTWDAKSFAPETGATEFTGLSIGFRIEEAEFGLRFDEASLWGLETDLLTARLGGERLDEAGPLFARLEGNGASYYGIAASFNTLLEGVLSEFDAELPDGMEVGIDAFDIQAETVIITDAALRSWELIKAPSELFEELDEDESQRVLKWVHFGQQMLAVSRSVSYGAAASYDTTGAFKIRQPGSVLEAEMSWELYGYRGVRGFDLDEVVMQNGRNMQVSTFTAIESEFDASPFPDGLGFAQEETIGLSRAENIRLDKVLGYLVRSELPGMSERDLLSLGRWTMDDYRLTLDDQSVFTAEKVAINADQFEWLIPSDMSFDFDQVTVNIDELTSFGQGLFETFTSNIDPADMSESDQAEMQMVREGLDKALTLLPEHGLDSITFDADARASWGPETGLSDFTLSSSADGFGESLFDLGITLPVYAQLQAAFEAEDKEIAFEEAFEAAFAFRDMTLMQRDGGGYDKILGFAQAIGKEYPNEGWGAMLGNMDPPQMRSYLATMIRMGKAEAGREFPPASDWLEAYADFIETGGTFEMKLTPPEPLTVEMLDGLEGEPEPDEIVDLLGISVTHTN